MLLHMSCIVGGQMKCLVGGEVVPPSLSTQAMAIGLKVHHALYCGGQVN